MLRRGGSLLCTTRILPPTNPKPDEWWYYALSGGQHVSLFTLDALGRLAARFGRRLVSDGVSTHLITTHQVSEWLFRLLVRRPAIGLLNRLRRRQSLVSSDFQEITGGPLGNRESGIGNRE